MLLKPRISPMASAIRRSRGCKPSGARVASKNSAMASVPKPLRTSTTVSALLPAAKASWVITDTVDNTTANNSAWAGVARKGRKYREN